MKFFIIIFFALVTSVSAQTKDSIISSGSDSLKLIQPDSMKIVKEGKATYYASYFHGRRTTSGEVFSNNKMTAAHRTLPFGTLVTITNQSNGNTIRVKINDRGPHNKAFIIDVSQAAAKELGFYKKGVTNVEISYLLPPKLASN
jgi:rare lipoprotein A